MQCHFEHQEAKGIWQTGMPFLLKLEKSCIRECIATWGR